MTLGDAVCWWFADLQAYYEIMVLPEKSWLELVNIPGYI